jgi:hypothetical protein
MVCNDETQFRCKRRSIHRSNSLWRLGCCCPGCCSRHSTVDLGDPAIGARRFSLTALAAHLGAGSATGWVARCSLPYPPRSCFIHHLPGDLQHESSTDRGITRRTDACDDAIIQRITCARSHRGASQHPPNVRRLGAGSIFRRDALLLGSMNFPWVKVPLM